MVATADAHAADEHAADEHAADGGVDPIDPSDPARLLSLEQLRALQLRRDGPSLRRVLAQGGLYFGSAAGLVAAGAGAPLLREPWAIAGLLLISTIVQFALFGLLHESCHNTVFTRRGLNRLTGWFAALAQPMSPALMRAFHFHHHRHTHALPEDPELGGLEFMAGWPRGPAWLLTISGLPLLLARFGWSLFAASTPAAADGAWRKVLPFVRPGERRGIGWEARLLIGVHAAGITLAFTVAPGLRWVYLGMILGHAILSVYVTCEHRGLPTAGTVLERTRSLQVPAVIRWLLWNMPYHAEHHGWPAVPWHALPALHAQVRPHLVHVARPLALHLHGGREA